MDTPSCRAAGTPDPVPATNEQIRRARPTVDSPLGRWIKGEIDEATYYQELNRKRAREGLPPATPESHPLVPRSSR